MMNIGRWDQVIRIILGIVLLSFVFVGPKTMGGFVGLVFLITGFFRFCPAYRILDCSTCKKEKK